MAGLRPLAVSSESPPLPITEFSRVLTPEPDRPLAPALARLLSPDAAEELL